tara:strand:+ start:168 stop:482 length:315 start_codon:yes stop_codon:yes gene_type:complete
MTNYNEIDNPLPNQKFDGFYEYEIEARASVPYAMFIYAKSDADARKIAEHKAESYQRTSKERLEEINTDTDYDSWSMRVDDYGLEIESVSRVCKMRPFIPGFDD